MLAMRAPITEPGEPISSVSAIERTTFTISNGTAARSCVSCMRAPLRNICSDWPAEL